MSFELPLDGVGPEGRSEEDFAADLQCFEKLLLLLPIERVREEVKSFLTGQLCARFTEALGNPEAILHEMDDMDSAELADLNRDVQELFRCEAERTAIDDDELEAESEHARRELLRHTLDMASSALDLVAPATRVFVNEALIPAKDESVTASFQEWTEQRKESLEELRSNLGLSGDGIQSLLAELVAALVERAQNGRVELPANVELVLENQRLMLRERPPTSQAPSSRQPQGSSQTKGKRSRSAVAARLPKAAKR